MRISAEQALERLKQSRPATDRVMMKTRGAGTEEEMTLVRTVKRESIDRVYMFRDGDTVTVSPADDMLPAVLGEFEVDGDIVLNPLALEWLSRMADEVKWEQDEGYPDYQPEEEEEEQEQEEEEEQEESNSNSGSMDSEPEFIDKLLGGIQWLQEEPYYNLNKYTATLSPNADEIGTEQMCLVGCPSTAAAQVLLYLYRQGYTTGCIATPRFNSTKMNGYRFDVPQMPRCEKFDFANMIDVYSHYEYNYSKKKDELKQDPYTETQANAAAKLCAHLGRAGKTWYSPGSSGMWLKDLANVLERGFGIKATYYPQREVLKEEDYNRIKQSLRDGIPVIMSGGNQHAFVCDGYRQSDNTYHFNWGYGPNRTDGWFYITTFKYKEVDNPSRKRSYPTYAKDIDYIILDPGSSPISPWVYDINKDGLINPLDWTIAINIMNAISVEKSIGGLTRSNGYSIRPVRKTTTQSTEHEYVDLGLESGTLWATCNIGADNPEDYGDYIAWLRTEANPEGEGYYPGDIDNINPGADIAGTQYDAATVRWGDGWRTPTEEDWLELIDNCKFQAVYEPTVFNDKYQYVRVTRKLTPEEEEEYEDQEITPPSIILPLCGYKWKSSDMEIGQQARYWTSTKGTGKKAIAVSLSLSLPSDRARIADVNYDGVVDMKDVQAIIDYVLGKNR